MLCALCLIFKLSDSKTNFKWIGQILNGLVDYQKTRSNKKSKWVRYQKRIKQKVKKDLCSKLQARGKRKQVQHNKYFKLIEKSVRKSKHL